MLVGKGKDLSELEESVRKFAFSEKSGREEGGRKTAEPRDEWGVGHIVMVNRCI